MQTNKKFYICKHCGNIIGMVEDKGVPVICCGEKMSELVPNTVEASAEKHLPVVTHSENGIHVEIGSAVHPAEEVHHIMFIYVDTEHGGQRKSLSPTEKPAADFSFVNDKPKAVYAYCNLHGLWKTDV